MIRVPTSRFFLLILILHTFSNIWFMISIVSWVPTAYKSKKQTDLSVDAATTLLPISDVPYLILLCRSTGHASMHIFSHVNSCWNVVCSRIPLPSFRSCNLRPLKFAFHSCRSFTDRGQLLLMNPDGIAGCMHRPHAVPLQHCINRPALKQESYIP